MKDIIHLVLATSVVLSAVTTETLAAPLPTFQNNHTVLSADKICQRDEFLPRNWNKIDTFTKQTLIITIQSCKLRHIQDLDRFNYFPSLQTLELNNLPQLTIFDLAFIANNRQLKALSFEGCPIESFEGDVPFSLENLTLTNSHFTGFPSPSLNITKYLKALNIFGSNFRGSLEEACGMYLNLETFNGKSCELRTLDKELVICYPGHVLSKQWYKLSIDRKMVHSITAHSCILKKNSDLNAFYKFSHIDTMNLTHLELQTFNFIDIKNNLYLKSLILDNNPITELQRDANVNLEYLSLRNTNLQELPNPFLNITKHLKSLDISGPRFHANLNDACGIYKTLETFNGKSCNLKTSDKELVICFPGEVLNKYWYKLSTDKKMVYSITANSCILKRNGDLDALYRFSNLHTLNLVQLGLSTFNFKNIKNNWRLRNLILDNNPIADFQKDANVNLEHLSLRETNLRKLPSPFLNITKHLKSLNISGPYFHESREEACDLYKLEMFNGRPCTQQSDANADKNIKNKVNVDINTKEAPSNVVVVIIVTLSIFIILSVVMISFYCLKYKRQIFTSRYRPVGQSQTTTAN